MNILVCILYDNHNRFILKKRGCSNCTARKAFVLGNFRDGASHGGREKGALPTLWNTGGE